MKEDIFRKESMEKAKSPEILNEYIKVCSPGVWMLLIAAGLLLIGALIWGFFGYADSTVKAELIIDEGKAFCIVSENDYDRIREGMKISFGKKEGALGPFISVDSLGVHYSVNYKGHAEDGIYSATILVSRVRPISFISN